MKKINPKEKWHKRNLPNQHLNRTMVTAETLVQVLTTLCMTSKFVILCTAFVYWQKA